MTETSTRGSLGVGVQLAGTYTIEGLIGTGGMGAVYLASHARLPGKRVAIKVLNAAVRNADMLARFRREAQITSKLGHPNIVDVLDFNSLEDGSPYLVLEFLDGESLADRMGRGPVALDVALAVARQVGSALAAAHRAGVVHRDLKPQNIFLVPTEVDGCSTQIAKVFDFGVSKILDSFTVQTQENQILGTPQYMSPEQATGRSPDIDGRSDQFALAVIVHEMLSGKPAFAGDSIPALLFNVVYEPPAPLEQAAPTTPAHILNALARAMQKDPNSRYATMEDFVRELTGVILPANRSVRVNILSPEQEFESVAAAPSLVTVNARPPNSTPIGQLA
ncbi:MAG: serine/threonine protein kinase, partial [Kofleriaceae bacterium]|nr:serine/threonine protein kinase [Kofleriaceae bacterium]